jgi:hypothetical protein
MTRERQNLINQYEAAKSQMKPITAKLRHVNAAAEVMSMFCFHLAGVTYSEYLQRHPECDINKEGKRVMQNMAVFVRDRLDEFVKKADTTEQRAEMADMLENFDIEGMAEVFKYMMMMNQEERDYMEQIALGFSEGTVIPAADSFYVADPLQHEHKAEPDGFTVSDEMVAEKQSHN